MRLLHTLLAIEFGCQVVSRQPVN